MLRGRRGQHAPISSKVTGETTNLASNHFSNNMPNQVTNTIAHAIAKYISTKLAYPVNDYSVHGGKTCLTVGNTCSLDYNKEILLINITDDATLTCYHKSKKLLIDFNDPNSWTTIEKFLSIEEYKAAHVECTTNLNDSTIKYRTRFGHKVVMSDTPYTS